MSVRYWVPVARELFDRREEWAPVDGWRLTGATRSSVRDHAIEVEVEDDYADPSLAGGLVELTISRTPDGPRISERTWLR